VLEGDREAVFEGNEDVDPEGMLMLGNGTMVYLDGGRPGGGISLLMWGIV